MVRVGMVGMVSALIALCALAGCKSGDGGGDGGNGAAGFSGIGGVGGFAGAGMGGAGVGGAGVSGAGAGGAGAGAGGAGMGAAGAPATVAGCEAAVAGDAATLHAAAAEVLTPMSPCGFSSCHTGMGKAGLILMGSTDLHALLVDKPSCEAPNVPLVSGATGQAALDNSWLWIKLTGPTDAQGAITSNAAWGTGGACGQTPAAPYGVRMPQMASGMTTSEERLAKIRNWICAGAPAPM